MYHPRDMHRRNQVEKLLARMGGTHTLEDVLTLIETGHMQSFSDDDTWVVTHVIQFPQKRVLEIFLVVGTMEGALALEPKVFEFAKQVNVDLVRAYGRDGWMGEMKKQDGWRAGIRIFFKEV